MPLSLSFVPSASAPDLVSRKLYISRFTSFALPWPGPIILMKHGSYRFGNFFSADFRQYGQPTLACLPISRVDPLLGNNMPQIEISYTLLSAYPLEYDFVYFRRSSNQFIASRGDALRKSNDLHVWQPRYLNQGFFQPLGKGLR